MIAVSTLLHREPTLAQALQTGVAWGAGHTTMLMGGVLLIGLLHIQVSEAFLGYLELPVALLLLALGGWVLYDLAARLARLRRHVHDGIGHFHVGEHPHPHGFLLKRSGWQGYAVGMIHGMAGTGALMLLVAATLPSLAASVLYALVFGIGSVLGMTAVTLALGSSFLLSRRRPIFYHTLTGLSGTLSMVLGMSILYVLWT